MRGKTAAKSGPTRRGTVPYGVVLSNQDRQALERAAELVTVRTRAVEPLATKTGPRTLAANLIREGVRRILETAAKPKARHAGA